MTDTDVGLVLPVDAPVAPFARFAEELGYDYVTAGDHIAFHSNVHSSFVWLATAAGATSSIRLATTVTVLALYPAVVAAKQIISLDFLSNGRLSLGVGVGGEYVEEFRACGVGLSDRGQRTDEALEILRLLYPAQLASFEGRFTRFDDIRILPGPVQNRLPVWIAGRKGPAMRRAARFGDLWVPYMYTPDQLHQSLIDVRRQMDEHGRSADDIAGGMYLYMTVMDDGPEARATCIDFVSERYEQDFSDMERYLVAGTPAECTKRLREYLAAGATTLVFDLASKPQHRESMMRRVAAEVLPALKETSSALGTSPQ